MDYFLFLFQFFCHLQKLSQSRQQDSGGKIENKIFNLLHSLSLSLSLLVCQQTKSSIFQLKKRIGGRIELGIESKIVLIDKHNPEN